MNFVALNVVMLNQATLFKRTQRHTTFRGGKP